VVTKSKAIKLSIAGLIALHVLSQQCAFVAIVHQSNVYQCNVRSIK